MNTPFTLDADVELADGGIRCTRKCTTVCIKLCRPSKRNALTQAMLQGLVQVMRAVDTTVRTVVISGAGPAFCAGADLNEMRQAGALGLTQNRRAAALLVTMLDAIAACPATVVVVAHGAVRGGGVGIICCADIVVAHSDMTAALPEVRLGLIPAVIMPWLLRRMPAHTVMPWLLGGEIINAGAAQQMGLVHDVVAPEDSDGAIDAWLARLNCAGPKALRAAKKLWLQLNPLPRASTKAQAVTMLCALRASEEGQDGLAAAADKRPPTWLRSHPVGLKKHP